MYESETDGVLVRVRPEFLPDQSSPEENEFVWAYTIEIVNQSDRTVQLLSRYWKITDANGALQEVQGAGVVGEQPVLNPGERFRYTSGCPLSTPSGLMVGVYSMVDESGARFDVDVPAFSLDSPHDGRRTLH